MQYALRYYHRFQGVSVHELWDLQADDEAPAFAEAISRIIRILDDEGRIWNVCEEDIEDFALVQYEEVGPIPAADALAAIQKRLAERQQGREQQNERDRRSTYLQLKEEAKAKGWDNP